MRRLKPLIVLFLILPVINGPLWAKVLYVSPDGNDLHSGLSWTTAKRTVTAALQIALPGDQIWVRYGVYYERIRMKNGVSLFGGFRGTETSLSQRPAFPRPIADPYETVLDGNQGGSVVISPVSANRGYRLDGFTIRNGSAEYGGGLHLTESASYLTVENCIISGNSASKWGGGVFCGQYSAPRLIGCIIRENSAAELGGGVFCERNSSPSFTRCSISDNWARLGGGGYFYGVASLMECNVSNNSAESGGGISGVPTLTRCTIADNRALRAGGGWEGVSVTATECVITGNWAGEVGGGISCANLVLSRCIIKGNAASEIGGGVYCHNRSEMTECVIEDNHARIGGGICSLNMYGLNCIISRNSAGDEGGGLYSWTESGIILVGCIVSYNRAGRIGGGLRGAYVLTNCTIVYNVAPDAGGVWTYRPNGMYNTIVAFNSGGGVRSSRQGYILRNNCIWGNTPYNFEGSFDYSIGNISEDPMVVAGHLLPGSPCINRGYNGAVSVDTDIDGETRIADGTVDIGADEFHAPIVHGYLLFNDLVGSPPLMVDWQIRTSSTTEARSLLIDRDGAFVIPRVPVGQFVLSVKPLSYLRRTVDVDTSESSVLNRVVALTNGDIDGDNEVTLFDFGRLVAAFGSSPPYDIHWDPRADLDGDNEVTLFDFGILVRNFGEIGDD